MEINIHHFQPLNHNYNPLFKSLYNIPISHNVPTVLFDAQTQVLPRQVAALAQLTAWELANILQPYTRIKKKDY
jgi:hypothetical protein